jgi:hypothetical protein
MQFSKVALSFEVDFKCMYVESCRTYVLFCQNELFFVKFSLLSVRFLYFLFDEHVFVSNRHVFESCSCRVRVESSRIESVCCMLHVTKTHTTNNERRLVRMFDTRRTPQKARGRGREGRRRGASPRRGRHVFSPNPTSDIRATKEYRENPTKSQGEASVRRL